MGSGIAQIFQSKLTDVDTIQRDPLGSIRWEGSKCYKYVQFKNTTATVAGAAGSMVAYGATSGYANNLVVADLSDAETIPVAAGACTAAVTGTNGTTYYCWIQIKGACTLDTAVTNGAAGKGFYLTSTDKTCAIGATDYDYQCGVGLDATTGVVLNCLF